MAKTYKEESQLLNSLKGSLAAHQLRSKAGLKDCIERVLL